jgi:hypothetical protein
MALYFSNEMLSDAIPAHLHKEQGEECKPTSYRRYQVHTVCIVTYRDRVLWYEYEMQFLDEVHVDSQIRATTLGLLLIG